MPLATGIVGPQVLSDGNPANVRIAKGGDLIVSELHGRFYEQTYRGNVYSGGMAALTAITNAIWTVATLDATAKPIAGVWNPIGSGVNMVILQASLGLAITNATSTGPGPFVWSAGLSSILLTLGTTPYNRKTGQAAGSVGKDMSGIALTGLTPSIVARFGSALGGGNSGNFSFVGTAAGPPTTLAASVENFDGSLIVPPGGVLALQSTTTAVAHSAVSSIIWEEVPV